MDFGDIEALQCFSDCLSCCDGNETGVLTLIQCILEKSCSSSRKNQGFRSMSSEAFDLLWKKAGCVARTDEAAGE